jgi:AraC-like DNA-binding protein
MKITYHQVTKAAQETLRVLEIRGSTFKCTWHFHPEFQLGLVIEGSGHRIVGDNIAPLAPGDLALLGPNLPHAWQFEDGRSTGLHGIVVYFDETVLGADFMQRPEAAHVKRLLARARLGLQIRGRTGRAAAEIIRQMPAHTGLQRVIDLLQVLHLMAESEELVPIASPGFVDEKPAIDGEKLRRVCEHIQQRITEPLRREEFAALAHLSPGAFSRYFKARTGTTFQDFVNDLRIGRACRLLESPDMNITEVAMACGFANVASFNRAFRRTKKMNPTEFRRQLVAMN